MCVQSFRYKYLQAYAVLSSSPTVLSSFTAEAMAFFRAAMSTWRMYVEQYVTDAESAESVEMQVFIIIMRLLVVIKPLSSLD